MITAIEWLVNELENHHVFHDIKNTVAYQQAKAIEREQIVKAFNEGTFANDEKTTAEQYYKENYETIRKP
jgi:hypothetical protein